MKNIVNGSSDLQNLLSLNDNSSYFCDISKIFLKWPNSQKLHLTSEHIKKNVLESDAVQSVINEIQISSGKKNEEIISEAEKILHRMCHEFFPRSYRSLLYLALKVFRKLFKEVNIDMQGIARIKHILKSHRVVLLPNHQSYLDFILISSILFLQGVPLPLIATTEDFLNMFIIATTMRETGAFFIKRGNIMNDTLYVTILTEYLKIIFLNFNHPLKFYIEGTRSRTGKPLNPKQGLLRILCDMYFNRYLEDFAILPISISYDRILEENLFAQERLGIPKPKETTEKLLKSFKVLQDDFGCVNMLVGEPIYLHEYFSSFNIVINKNVPRNLSTLKQQDIECIKDLSKLVIKRGASLFIIPAISAMAFVMMSHLQSGKKSIKFNVLEKEVKQLLDLFRHMKLNNSIDEDNLRNEIQKAVKIHKRILSFENEEISLCYDYNSNYSASFQFPCKFSCNVVSFLIITFYSNQVLHIVSMICLLSFVLLHQKKSSCSFNDLKEDTKFLAELVQREFVFHKKSLEKEIEISFQALIDLKLISSDGNFIKILDHYTLQSFSNLISPYIIIIKFICIICQRATDYETIISVCQDYGVKLIKSGFYDVRLNIKDNIKSGIASLVDCKAIATIKSESTFIQKHDIFYKFISKLETFGICDEFFKEINFNANHGSTLLKAKL